MAAPRFRLGGDVTVKAGEAVGSDVVVVLGSAHVEGRVDGDVVAVGGSVFLGPKADVQGSVTSVGGQVARADGAKVGGEINEVRVSAPTFGPFVHVRPWREWTWFASPFGAPADLIGTLVRMGLVGVVRGAARRDGAGTRAPRGRPGRRPSRGARAWSGWRRNCSSCRCSS